MWMACCRRRCFGARLLVMRIGSPFCSRDELGLFDNAHRLHCLDNSAAMRVSQREVSREGSKVYRMASFLSREALVSIPIEATPSSVPDPSSRETGFQVRTRIRGRSWSGGSGDRVHARET